MRPAFYDNLEYKRKQAEITRKYWKIGIFDSKRKPFQKKVCKNPTCQLSFQVKPHDLHKRKYCSSRCAGLVNSPLRKASLETRLKISAALKGNQNPLKGLPKVRITIKCFNCQKEFKVQPYLKNRRKFCSNRCAMSVIGSQTTSPKASKGKSGIRIDIDPKICFYSTWEANIARVFNFLGITWEYAPTIFELGNHTYRPDFFLPEDNSYIEVKNFMNDYSFKRDQLFRIKYPHIKLEVLSKKEYKEIEADYKPLIDFWER